MKKFLKRMLYNGKGDVSLTKVGGTLVAVAGAILAMPMASEQANIVIHIPNWIMVVAWITVFIGGKIGIDGARDAIDRK